MYLIGSSVWIIFLKLICIDLPSPNIWCNLTNSIEDKKKICYKLHVLEIEKFLVWECFSRNIVCNFTSDIFLVKYWRWNLNTTL